MSDDRITSGKAFNAEVDRYKARFREMVEEYKEAAMASGYPPGQVPVAPHNQYMMLKRAQLANEPWFAADMEAQHALEVLERRYSGAGVRS